MQYIRAENLAFFFETEPEPVLTDVTFTLSDGERVGLIGDNGSGKTTLLALIRSELTSTGGTLHAARSVRLGYLPQEVMTEKSTKVLDFLWKGRPELDRMRFELLSADQADPSYGDIVSQFYAAGGAQTEALIERLRAGFRLAGQLENSPMSSLKGATANSANGDNRFGLTHHPLVFGAGGKGLRRKGTLHRQDAVKMVDFVLK